MAKKKRKESIPLQQLCLFDDKQMQEMEETREPVKARSEKSLREPDWILWQMGILSGLSGKSFRDQRAMLTGKTKPGILYN